jgi:hypothetical protein
MESINDVARLHLDPTWNLTTVEEGFTYVASEGAAKLPRLSSTRFSFQLDLKSDASHC